MAFPLTKKQQQQQHFNVFDVKTVDLNIEWLRIKGHDIFWRLQIFQSVTERIFRFYVNSSKGFFLHRLNLLIKPVYQ